MLNTILALLTTTVGLSAFAETATFTGIDPQGAACSMTIHNAENVTGDWGTFEILVSTRWQLGADAIKATPSPTPFTYYGRSLTTMDRIAITFDNAAKASLDLISSFVFQTKSAETGLFQSQCRSLTRKEAK